MLRGFAAPHLRLNAGVSSQMKRILTLGHIFCLLVAATLASANEYPLMQDNIGKQITLAITVHPQTEAEKTGIDLNVGRLSENGGNFYLVNSKGNLKLPNSWLAKIKPMNPSIAHILGNSELLLPVTQEEFAAQFGAYTTDPSKDKTIEVVD